MPETAVYQNNFHMPGQNNIRASWQVFAVQPEPVAQAVQDAAHGLFRFRILAADAAHKSGPVFFRYRIQGIGPLQLPL